MRTSNTSLIINSIIISLSIVMATHKANAHTPTPNMSASVRTFNVGNSNYGGVNNTSFNRVTNVKYNKSVILKAKQLQSKLAATRLEPAELYETINVCPDGWASRDNGCVIKSSKFIKGRG